MLIQRIIVTFLSWLSVYFMLIQKIFVTLIYDSQFILCFWKEYLLPCFYDSQCISCYVAVMLLSLFYNSLKKHCFVTLILPHRIIVSTESLHYIIFQALEYVMLSLWQSWKHNIHSKKRNNQCYKYLNKTSPLFSLFVNPINKPLIIPILI